MLPFALDSLTYADLDRLVRAGLTEDRALDFKRDAPGLRDNPEFAADIAAMANTIGGDLVFGVDEDGGMATTIPGLPGTDPDKLKLRLEDIARTSLDPRLPQLHLRWLEPPEGAHGVLVCRVPRSYAAPHRVRTTHRFHARASAGKYDMDTAQLRTAILASDTLVQSIRRFRAERLDVIEAGEGAMPLSPGAKAVLHIVPLSSFATRADIVVGEQGAMLLPLSGSFGTSGTRYTLEGFATYRWDEIRQGIASAYTLLFRSGVIEAALSIQGNTERMIAASTFEWPIVRSFTAYLHSLSAQHGVEGPYYVLLTLLGVRGYGHLFGTIPQYGSHTFNRDRLAVPELIVDAAPSEAEEAGALLRPIFDQV